MAVFTKKDAARATVLAPRLRKINLRLSALLDQREVAFIAGDEASAIAKLDARLQPRRGVGNARSGHCLAGSLRQEALGDT
jgi:hypothetical protein